MDENNIEIMSYDAEEEIEAILPDGWAEGDDYFDSGSWTGNTEADSAPAEVDAQTSAEESAAEDAEEQTPATEESEEGELNTEAEEESPATETPTQMPTKLKVKYQFNHKEVEEELDQATLPEIMQMARSAERYKARAAQSEVLHGKASEVAKILGYDSPEALMDEVLKNAKETERAALLSKGNSEEIVDDFLARKYGKAEAAKEIVEEAPAQNETQKTAPQNQFAIQARELLAAAPELVGQQKLPDEVIRGFAEGKGTLLELYRQYKANAETAEINRIKKENQILKQNAASAKRAPVVGVSRGGSTNVQPEDAFLSGFNSDY